ncbi:MAG: XRE family transcriptional regulator [Flavobacteriales bacterium]|nr:XRE family transcriptional regulator [Flavobacteriales bacterium]
MAQKELDPRLLKVAAGIKDLRIKAGYTSLEAFAFDHEIPRVQYWRMETGANLTMMSLLKVLDIHKVHMEEFSKSIGI